MAAFGLKNVIGISAEQVLRHYGYSKKYLDLYEAQNVDPETLRTQERWRTAVKEEPGYVLPEVQFFENDARLKEIMGALKLWYGQEKLENYGLADFEKMTSPEIRAKISEIDRKKIVDAWLAKEFAVDTNAWKTEIADYNRRSEAWLSRTAP